MNVENELQQEGGTQNGGGAVTKLPKISEQYMNQYKSLLEKINIRKQVNVRIAEILYSNGRN